MISLPYSRDSRNNRQRFSIVPLGKTERKRVYDELLLEKFRYFRKEFVEACNASNIIISLDIIDDVEGRFFSFIEKKGPQQVFQVIRNNNENINVLRCSVSLLIIVITILQYKLNDAINTKEKHAGVPLRASLPELNKWISTALGDIADASLTITIINILKYSTTLSINELLLTLISHITSASDETSQLLLTKQSSKNLSISIIQESLKSEFRVNTLQSSIVNNNSSSSSSTTRSTSPNSLLNLNPNARRRKDSDAFIINSNYNNTNNNIGIDDSSKVLQLVDIFSGKKNKDSITNFSYVLSVAFSFPNRDVLMGTVAEIVIAIIKFYHRGTEEVLAAACTEIATTRIMHLPFPKEVQVEKNKRRSLRDLPRDDNNSKKTDKAPSTLPIDWACIKLFLKFLHRFERCIMNVDDNTNNNNNNNNNNSPSSNIIMDHNDVIGSSSVNFQLPPRDSFSSLSLSSSSFSSSSSSVNSSSQSVLSTGSVSLARANLPSLQKRTLNHAYCQVLKAVCMMITYSPQVAIFVNSFGGSVLVLKSATRSYSLPKDMITLTEECVAALDRERFILAQKEREDANRSPHSRGRSLTTISSSSSISSIKSNSTKVSIKPSDRSLSPLSVQSSFSSLPPLPSSPAIPQMYNNIHNNNSIINTNNSSSKSVIVNDAIRSSFSSLNTVNEETYDVEIEIYGRENNIDNANDIMKLAKSQNDKSSSSSALSISSSISTALDTNNRRLNESSSIIANNINLLSPTSKNIRNKGSGKSKFSLAEGFLNRLPGIPSIPRNLNTDDIINIDDKVRALSRGAAVLPSSTHAASSSSASASTYSSSAVELRELSDLMARSIAVSAVNTRLALETIEYEGTTHNGKHTVPIIERAKRAYFGDSPLSSPLSRATLASRDRYYDKINFARKDFDDNSSIASQSVNYDNTDQRVNSLPSNFDSYDSKDNDILFTDVHKDAKNDRLNKLSIDVEDEIEEFDDQGLKIGYLPSSPAVVMDMLLEGMDEKFILADISDIGNNERLINNNKSSPKLTYPLRPSSMTSMIGSSAALTQDYEKIDYLNIDNVSNNSDHENQLLDEGTHHYFININSVNNTDVEKLNNDDDYIEITSKEDDESKILNQDIANAHSSDFKTEEKDNFELNNKIDNDKTNIYVKADDDFDAVDDAKTDEIKNYFGFGSDFAYHDEDDEHEHQNDRINYFAVNIEDQNKNTEKETLSDDENENGSDFFSLAMG